MCFEVPTLVPPGGVANGNKSGNNDDDDDDANDDDLGIMDIDDNDGKTGNPFSLICFIITCLSVKITYGFWHFAASPCLLYD